MSQQLQAIDTRGWNVDTAKKATSVHIPTLGWMLVILLIVFLLYHFVIR